MKQEEILARIVNGKQGIICKVFNKAFPGDGLLIQINSDRLGRNVIYEEKAVSPGGFYQIDNFEIRYIDLIDAWNLQILGFIGAMENHVVQEILSEFFDEGVDFDELKERLRLLTR